MRIQSIKMENFRLFEAREFHFPARFTVVIGENGAGKTTLMEGLGELLANIVQTFEVSESQLPRIGQFRYWSDGFGNFVRSGTLRITSNITWPAIPEILTYDIIAHHSTGKTRTFVDASDFGEFQTGILKAIEGGQFPILPVMAAFGTSFYLKQEPIPYSSKSTRLEAGYVGALETNTSSNSFLSWFKTFEDEAQKFKQDYVIQQLKSVKEAIMAIIPEWQDLAYSFLEDDLVGMYRDADGKTNLRLFRDLSDGYRRVISMVANIAYRCVRLNPHLRENAITESPGVVLIDEIDQHLHPSWQRRIVDDLKRVFPNLQFVVTTHSPFVVQSLEANEIINLDGVVDVNPSKLSIGDIAEEIMGVESEFGIDNHQTEQVAKEFLERLERPKKVYRGSEPDDNEAALDALEKQISDPTMRAFLQLKRMKPR